jgi:glutamate-1-semialdehyde 2,1-aminomutase
MQAAQTTFISSTYWTERVGFTAALETIKIFQRDRVAEKITKAGEYLAEGLRGIFTKHSLKIGVTGISSVLIMAAEENEPLVVKTVFTQEMLKKGFLASNMIYVSIAHTREIMDRYLTAADEIFGKIAQAIRSNTLKEMLDGPVCHAGFKRLA